MFVVLKHGERICALKCARSSLLSAISYDDKVPVSRTAAQCNLARAINETNEELIVAYLLLDVPKQTLEWPTSYVPFDVAYKDSDDVEGMLRMVEMQPSMMYDLFYTKAAVVHTWYGLCTHGR
jgi:hypothetical protein